MGLPSGLLWATRNVGADTPTNAGLYFSWGNVGGYGKGDTHNYDQQAYADSPGSAIDSDLGSGEDAARVVMGSPWRMPSADEMTELLANCSLERVSVGGVECVEFTSSVNGKTLVVPVAGYWTGYDVVSEGLDLYLWSSTYKSESQSDALNYPAGGVARVSAVSRYRARTIRAVRDP